MEVLLKVTDISKSYNDKLILNNVSIQLKNKRIAALLGESGSGKTTLSKIITGLERNDKGRIYLFGKELQQLKKRSFCDCAEIQYIFQDPYSSLEDCWTIYKTLMEPIRLCKRHKRMYMEMESVLDLVGIEDYDRYLDINISSLSGGQRQRIAVARALITRPSLIIADESAAMLDKNSRKDIYEVFSKLKEELDISVLIITHDIELLKNYVDEIYVLDNGEIVETGRAEIIFNNPRSNYLIKLLESYSKLNGGT